MDISKAVGALQTYPRRILRRLPRSRRQPLSAISPDLVEFAYRLFLDREPESRAVVLAWSQQSKTTSELRTAFMTSYEFRSNNPGLGYVNDSIVVIKEIFDDLRLFVDLADYYISFPIIRGCYEPDGVAFVRKTVKSGDVVVDIGANIGFYTILLGQLVGQRGKVYAFEPVERTSGMLRRSISENGFADRVVLQRAAVGSETQSGAIFVAKKSGNSGQAFLALPGLEPPYPHDVQGIQIAALDDSVRHRPVSFMKMDIDGAEPLAIRGASSILREDRPVILSEIAPTALKTISGCSAPAYIAEVNSYGYECYLLQDGSLGSRVTDVSGEVVSVVFMPRSDHGA